MIVNFLHIHRHLYSIERMCHVFNEHEYDISPATYYRYISRVAPHTGRTRGSVCCPQAVHAVGEGEARLCGRRKLWKVFLRAGWWIGRDQVQRLMNILGIKRAPEEVATHSDQWRAADFTYVSTLQGWVCVSSVEDVCTRETLAVVDIQTDNSLVACALRQALATRKCQDSFFKSAGVIHHSDAGSQYTLTDLRDLLQRHGMDGSIGAIGDAYDDGLMESVIGRYKSELIHVEVAAWANRQEGRPRLSAGSTGAIPTGCIHRLGTSHPVRDTPTIFNTQPSRLPNTPLSKLRPIQYAPGFPPFSEAFRVTRVFCTLVSIRIECVTHNSMVNL